MRSKPYLDLHNAKLTEIDLINPFDICQDENCFNNTRISWDDANIYCQNKNMDLPSMNSYGDMVALFQVNFLDDNQDRRISLYEKIGIYIGLNFEVSISFHLKF